MRGGGLIRKYRNLSNPRFDSVMFGRAVVVASLQRPGRCSVQYARSLTVTEIKLLILATLLSLQGHTLFADAEHSVYDTYYQTAM